MAGAGALSALIIKRLVSTVADISTGTGGTIAGTGQFLKSMNEDISIALADPEGSGLYNKVTLNACIAPLRTQSDIALSLFFDLLRTIRALVMSGAGCERKLYRRCDFGTPLVQYTAALCTFDILMPVSGYARGNVRQERERGHQAETSSGYRSRGHVSYIACASLLLPPCITYLPYDRIVLIHFY